MRDRVEALPDQLRRAWSRYGGLDLGAPQQPIEAVIVAGMGGSAVAGDLVAHLWSSSLRVPMATLRGAPLPGWVSASTLVIASSYSGDTSETLQSIAEAEGRGAQRVAVTSGGALARRAKADSIEVVPLPGGSPPRAALGDSLAAILAVLHSYEVLPDPGRDLDGAAAAMASLVAADSGPDSPAALAPRLAGRIPIIYAPAAAEPVARRWKTQLNENAKTASFYECRPEAHHNAVVGYRFPAAQGEAIVVVNLVVPSAGHRDIEAAGVQVMDEAGIPHVTVEAPADRLPVEALWLLQYGDLISVHLAAVLGVDPSPVDAITRLKAHLHSAP